MNDRLRPIALGTLIGGLAGCASATPVATTIEPPSTIEPRPTPSTPRAKPRPAAGGDFVLSRARKQDAQVEEITLHTGDKWWRFRADYLKIGEAQARDRDVGINEAQAPRDFWDPQSAREAVQTWTAVCNECHGGRRRMDDALRMPAPPPAWGKGEGLFFGKRRPYSEVFGIIYRGGPERSGEKSEMPPWRGKIAKELIWSLLYFLEYQSGGIEGRFPPSLFPRLGDDARRTVD